MQVSRQMRARETQGAVPAAGRREVRQEARKAVAREALKGKSFAEGRAMLQPEGPGIDPLKDPKAQPNAKSEHVPDPKWGNVKGTAFVKGEGDASDISPDDVNQGQLGDCYFVASLAAIARQRPEELRKRVKDNGDGTWTVTFAEGGDVVVDAQFPVDAGGEPVYAGAGDKSADGVELWVALIEKAWAKLKGGYEDIRGSKVKMKSDDAMQAVTGKDTRTVRPKSLGDDELLKVMGDAMVRGWSMTLGAYTKDDVDEKTRDEAQKLGIVFNHAYAVMGVDARSREVTLYNPWGRAYKVPKLTPDLVKKFYNVLHINKT
jgi:hypothetical protein